MVNLFFEVIYLSSKWHQSPVLPPPTSKTCLISGVNYILILTVRWRGAAGGIRKRCDDGCQDLSEGRSGESGEERRFVSSPDGLVAPGPDRPGPDQPSPWPGQARPLDGKRPKKISPKRVMDHASSPLGSPTRTRRRTYQHSCIPQRCDSSRHLTMSPLYQQPMTWRLRYAPPHHTSCSSSEDANPGIEFWMS